MTEPDFELPHDVLLGGDFSRRLGQHGAAEPVQTTAPAPLDGGGAVFTPQQMGLVNSLGATSVPASYGNYAIPMLQPVTPNAYQDLAQRRLRRYMQEHAEQAALNSPQGLVPFARVPEIRK